MIINLQYVNDWLIIISLNLAFWPDDNKRGPVQQSVNRTSYAQFFSEYFFPVNAWNFVSSSSSPSFTGGSLFFTV